MLKKLEELGFTVLDTAKTESKPRVELYIMGDCNDADYEETTTEFELNDNDDLEYIKEIIEFIKEGKNYEAIMTKHFFTDYEEVGRKLGLDEDEAYELYEKALEILDIPSDQCDICHTIYYLNFTYIDENGTRYPLSLGLDGEEHREVVEIIDRDYEEDCENDAYADEDYED